MEPTEEQILAKVAESGGALSHAKAREVLIGLAAHEASKEAKPEGGGDKPATNLPVLKGAVTKARNTLSADPKNQDLIKALADAEAALASAQ